jgi:hypothetical protein
MDDTTGRVAADSGLTPQDKARTREIREEITQTRADLSETIEAIQERLAPSNLAAQAGETVRNATTEKVKQMANTAGRAADQVMDTPVVETIRSNPIPAAMIGIGAAWLLNKGRGDAPRYRSRGRRRNFGHRSEWRVPGAGDTSETSGAVGTTGSANYGTTGGEYAGGSGGGYGTEAAGGFGAYAGSESGYGGYGSTGASGYDRDYRGGDYGYRRSSGFSMERVARETPLALGAAAALIGVAIGLTVPSTETEDRLMGETRDNVVDRAREAAGEAVEKVQDAAQSAANAAGNIKGAVAPDTGSESRPTTSRNREGARGKGTSS